MNISISTETAVIINTINYATIFLFYFLIYFIFFNYPQRLMTRREKDWFECLILLRQYFVRSALIII